MQPPCDVKRSVDRHLIAIAAVALVLVGGLGVVSAATHLSGAVMATGSLVVRTSSKKVQHPTGGVVGQLLVEDGSNVEAGQILVRLDETIARATLTAVVKELWELEARRSRLEAERDGTDEVAFPPELISAAGNDPAVDKIVTGERAFFLLRRDARESQKQQLRQRIEQLKNEIVGLGDQGSAKITEAALVSKELDGVRELYQKNLAQLPRLNALERDAARIAGEHGTLVASVAQAKGKIAETELQIIQIGNDMRSDVAKQLADIRSKVSDLVERKVTAADQLRHTDIRAPQRGIVHELSVHAAGSVITAGEQIMLIVPDADQLVAEVRLAPQDIDQISQNQPVILRFPSFNQRTTPEREAHVLRVAADTTQDSRTGSSYYSVQIAMNQKDDDASHVKLIPGMPVDAFIRTSDRSMLSYLIKPLADQMERTFREK
jgi:HlyD family secretion protein